MPSTALFYWRIWSMPGSIARRTITGAAGLSTGARKARSKIATYARVKNSLGVVHLVQRDANVLRPGEARVYLPGDIHDTRCLTDTALLFRFTERDLKIEDQKHHLVTRYEQQNGLWVPPAP